MGKPELSKGIYSNFLIFDNFLNDYEMNVLKDIVINRFKGNMTNNEYKPIVGLHSSMGFHPYNYTHWSTGWNNDFLNIELLNKIKKATGKNLEIKRVYTSFQGINEFGLWHTDDRTLNDYTFTLYLAISKNPYEEELFENIFEIKSALMKSIEKFNMF